jgi:methyl-accepting chemotaxis protein
MAARAEELLVRIDATTEQLRREMKRADDTVERSTRKINRALGSVDRAFAGVNAAARAAAGGLGAIGLALSGGAILQGADQALRRIQDIQRTALALGESTATVQELNYTFAQFGLQSEDVSDALNTLADRAQDAVDGTKSMVEDFGLLGLTVEDLRGKDPGELFTTLAGAVARVEDPTARAAGVVRLLGDDLGRRLLPLLIEGADGVRRYREEAQELNVVLGYDAVQAGADAARELAKVKAIFDAQFSRAVTQNADAFTELASTLSSPEFQTGMQTAVSLFSSLAESIAESVGEIGDFSESVRQMDWEGIGRFLASRTGPGFAYELLTGNDIASPEQPSGEKPRSRPRAPLTPPTPIASDPRLPNVIAGYEPGSVEYDPVASMERMQGYFEVIEETYQKHQDRLTSIEEQAFAHRLQFEQASYSKKASIIFGELSNITAGVAQHNRTLFELNKAAGIADAVVNAYIGISKTLSAYPYPINMAMAAAHGVAAFAQVSAIRATSFNGGGGGSAPSIAGSTAATPVSPVSTASDMAGAQPERREPTEITIRMEGRGDPSRRDVERLLGKINELIDDGYRLGRIKLV